MSESLLFSPITLRGITSRNRIWVAPMAQYSAPESGVPTDWHLAHLGGMARGGAGLVMTEATAVEPAGRLGSADTGIWEDEQVEAWRRSLGSCRTWAPLLRSNWPTPAVGQYQPPWIRSR